MICKAVKDISRARLGMVLSCAILVLLAGCRGTPARGERAARHDLKSVAQIYRPAQHRPALPSLKPDSPFTNYLQFALLNSPRVEAAYEDWAASVERITVERSLPDPQLTLQAYITDVVSSLMPGFLWNLPGPGKLKARAAVAAGESQNKYFTFESAVLDAAFEFERSSFELQLLTERLRIDRQTLSLLNELERIARAQNEVGRGTLQDVLRAQIELDRVQSEIANLEESRVPMFTTYKAALGLSRDEPDPPVPASFQGSEFNPDFDELLRSAYTNNPKLKAMEADVLAAEAGISVAYKERVPDFSAGLMADVKASPILYWPQLSMSLPIWRDKLAAELAHAKASELAARARLSAEQISLTVSLAEKTFAYRQISRNLSLFHEDLIPKARQSLELARGGYLAGTIDFLNLVDAERTLLNFEMSEVEARTQQHIVLAELSLILAGRAPAGAPLLDPAPHTPTSR
jgi:outer membrane protein TolC